MKDNSERILELISDREAFNDLVYTPLDEAVELIKQRWVDLSIPTSTDTPAPLKTQYKALLWVSLITPNFEIRKYIDMVKSVGLEPLIFEHLADKFTSNNEWKHSLGKMPFYMGTGKKGGKKYERRNVIDFNLVNGKEIVTVKTKWGQPLVDFHHELFFMAFPTLGPQNLFDASSWFKAHGGKPTEYYKVFLTLLLKHGIQFENFYLNDLEKDFTRDIFLPAFLSVYEETGYKPLIVSLEPTNSEGDEYWYAHTMETLQIVEKRLT